MSGNLSSRPLNLKSGGPLSDIELAAGSLTTLVEHAASRDRNPYWTYLARMNSAESRRTMKGALHRVAQMLMPRAGGVPPDYGELVPWHLLAYGPSSAVRERLAGQVEE